MAKIDLKKSSGLAITFNGEELVFTDTCPAIINPRSIDEVRNQLLNKELTCPEIFYMKYNNIDQDGIFGKKKLSVNFYVLQPNLAGIEYVKTRASNLMEYPRILEVVYGGGVILMQKFINKFESDIIRVQAKKNMKIIVPPGYSVSIINSRQSTMVVNEVHIKDSQPKPVLDDMNGMAYYVIRKNAKQEIVRNPAYRAATEPRSVNWDKVVANHSMTLKTPLIKQILRKYDKFKWLFSKDDITL